MLGRKPVTFAWLALILLFTSICLLCGLFGLLATRTGSLSDPYAAIRTSMAENNLLTPITAGPTTTPRPEVTLSPSTPSAIFSTAGKLSDQTAPATLNVTSILTATPVRARTTTPTPTPDQSAPTTDTTLGPCDCEEYSEDDPRNLDCTTTSFDTVADAQACFDFCIGRTGIDVYGLDDDNNGNACEEGLSTPTPTP
jgi:hypothetical protein